VLIGKFAHLLEAEEVRIGIPECLLQQGQAELKEVLEGRFLGEPPDIIGETRKGIGDCLAIIKGLLVIHFDGFVREIAVAAEIVLHIGVFLSLFV